MNDGSHRGATPTATGGPRSGGPHHSPSDPDAGACVRRRSAMIGRVPPAWRPYLPWVGVVAAFVGGLVVLFGAVALFLASLDPAPGGTDRAAAAAPTLSAGPTPAPGPQPRVQVVPGTPAPAFIPVPYT